MNTAAIYSRKSKYTGKGESIDNQINSCKEYLKRLHVSNYLLYEDEGFSGKSLDRPNFKKMMKDAKSKKFDVIICYRLDRVSRNVADFASLIQELEKYNIGFISVNEQFDTTTPLGRAMMYIASVFSQLERETIAERIRDNMIELAKTGRWLGGETPTGYKSKAITYIDADLKERKLFKLTPIETELELVKLIFDKYWEFKSLSQVEKYLLTNNYITKRGNDFSKNKIRTILNNPVYVKCTEKLFEYLEGKGITVVGIPDKISGMLSYNKRKGKTGYRDMDEWIYAVSKHKGVIEADRWIEIQEILLQNSIKAPRLGKTNTALLGGLVRCAICGHSMRIAYGKLTKSAGTRPFYYACSMKHNSGATRCNNKNVNGRILEELVINKLKELSFDEGRLIQELEQYKNELSTNGLKKSEITNIINNIDNNKASIANLVDTIAITPNSESKQLLLNKIEELTGENKKLEIKLNELKEAKNETESQIYNVDIMMDALKNFTSTIDFCTFEEKRFLLGRIIDKITWNGETGIVEIHLWGANS